MSGRVKAGFLTIGQSPRPDILDEMRGILSPRILVAEYGALDGLSPEEVGSLAPRDGGDVFVTRLRNGTEARVSTAAVRERIREKLDEAFGEGCALCVILCTGVFEYPEARGPVLASDEVFHGALRFPGGVKTVGVIVPEADQEKTFRAYWTGYGKRILMGNASPYADQEALVREALRLRGLGADCLCLDCMGYTASHGERLRALTGLDVKVPRLETAVRVNEWIREL